MNSLCATFRAQHPQPGLRLQLVFRLAVAIAMLAVVPPSHADPLHAWADPVSPASLRSWTQAHLAHVAELLSKVVAPDAADTASARLVPFDEALGELSMVNAQLSLLAHAHDSRGIRDAAQKLLGKSTAKVDGLFLDPRTYRALARIQATREDLATRHVLERMLLEFQLSGATLGDQERAQVRRELEAAARAGGDFTRAIREGHGEIEADEAELAGLPDDFLRSHPAGPGGKVSIGLTAPEVNTVLTFADSDRLRRRLQLAYDNRAMPANELRLRDLLTSRKRIARLVGRENYAELALADEMMDSPEKLEEFLAKVDAVTSESSRREYEALLGFARRAQPGLAALDRSGRLYWQERYRREVLHADAQALRPYLPYARVEAGLMDVAAGFFRVRFERVPDAVTWHPSVSAWDVFDTDPASARAGQRVGRVYLDMHAREGKMQWFDSSLLVPRRAGRVEPEGLLLCNFPGGAAGDPGLMRIEDARRFLHGLGQLLHELLAARPRWESAGVAFVEADFAEAPTLLLEEMASNPDLLRSFARHYVTGEVVPRDLLERSNRAAAFGRALEEQGEIRMAAFTFELFRAEPEHLDISALDASVTRRYDPFAPVPGAHPYAQLHHIVDSGSIYYGYVVDRVIALDFLSQFDRASPLPGEAALRYRRKVLEPGGTRPAEELIRDFLGRTWNFDAYSNWLREATER
jgi:thimet oligopeptidase